MSKSVSATETDALLEFLRPDCVVNLPSHAGKEEVLAFMVESLAVKGGLPEHLVPSITSALTHRERLGTTGLGHGLALPHLRRQEVTDFVGLIGVAAAGVDFESLDGLPTRIVILVISPFDKRERHVEILGRLATLFLDKTLQYSMQIPRSPEALLRFLGINTKGLDPHE